MKFMILTRPNDGEAIYCNVDNICAFYRNYNDKNKTVVQFAGDEENYLDVLESPEAIAKLKAYEEKQKAADDIKVGDEMRQVRESGAETGVRCIVTAIDGVCMSGFSQDGRAVVCSSHVNRWWKKTGRHFNIDKILEEMRK